MEAANLLIYIILIIVLVSLIGVSGWLLYDYNNLKTQLSGDFKIISNRFSIHKTKDNTLESDLKKNTSNITELTDSIEEVKDLTKTDVDIVKAITTKHEANFSTFNDNLNKYFTFGTKDSGINAADNKIYSYITDNKSLIENDKILTLINKTIISSELTVDGGTKLKTDSKKKLNVCGISGDSCFEIYNDGKDLIIKTPDSSSGKIKIGGGSDDDSLVIDSEGDLKFKGKLVHHEGDSHTHPHTHKYIKNKTHNHDDAGNVIDEKEVEEETKEAIYPEATVTDAALVAAVDLLKSQKDFNIKNLKKLFGL